jgi:predicted alpha/beta superfamily hydrolase
VNEKASYYGYVRVFYPLRRGRLVLRVDGDWDRDIEPTHVSEDGERFDFLLQRDEPYLLCKPLLHHEGQEQWAAGANKLVILSETPQDLYPHFYSRERGRITEILECPSQILGRTLRMRLYLPPGYDENHLKRYPVLYMHDGRNLFFPQESFLGKEWEIDETLDLLDRMSLIDQTIVVGVHASERAKDYTLPGYETFGAALVEELKPWVDRTYRTLIGPKDTAVMGASLGGVVSLFLAWEYPHVFGNAACMSTTFGYRDDLLHRVRNDPLETRRDLRVYLDSGWPGDNYEATLTMANALLLRGFVRGCEVLHLAFPQAPHSEASWAARVHIPLQVFSGKSRRVVERQSRPHPTSRKRASRVLYRSRLHLEGDSAPA